MGLLRLWVIPRGADPNEGAYLAYPIDDLLRLIGAGIASASSDRHRRGPRHGAGGLSRPDAVATGIYGMRVLWFERERNRFAPPQAWSTGAAAMTSTHDLPTVAGWWRGTISTCAAQCGLVEDPDKEQRDENDGPRDAVARVAAGRRPPSGDLPSPSETSRVVDAAVRFIAQTPSQLALLPLEDALAVEDQPNLPGTIDEHPNWRRRYAGQAEELLEPSGRQDGGSIR